MTFYIRHVAVLLSVSVFLFESIMPVYASEMAFKVTEDAARRLAAEAYYGSLRWEKSFESGGDFKDYLPFIVFEALGSTKAALDISL